MGTVVLFCLAHFSSLRVLLAGGCSCAGCACEADYQAGGLNWHGHQDISEGRFVGGPNASGQLGLAICMQSEASALRVHSMSR